MALIFSDNFSGTVIDTAKWTETDPNGLISQNNQLLIDAPHSGTVASFTNQLKSVNSVTSGVATLQTRMTWTDPGGSEAVQEFYLWVDNTHYARILTRSSGGTYRLITSAGYDFETDIAIPQDVKITYDITSHDIKFWYWSGSAWTQMGTTQNSNIGSTVFAIYTVSDSASFSNADQGQYDDFYMSNADYSTHYPVTTAIKNWNGLAISSIKQVNGLEIASVKNVNGLV